MPNRERILASSLIFTTEDGGTTNFLFPLVYLYISDTMLFCQVLLIASLKRTLYLLFYSHRYLLPLIHYHKFLVKCIKKLKRNKIDVKTSLSPVSAFLREEVCAVSDHLMASSKFTSDEWMAGLPHFNGWVNHNPEIQKPLQQMVSKLPIRNLTKPTDVDSPISRSHIDQCFLKAMAEAREQIKDKAATNDSLIVCKEGNFKVILFLSHMYEIVAFVYCLFIVCFY